MRVQVANADANTRFRFYNNQATRYMVYHIDNIEVRKSDVISNIPDGVTVLGTVTCEGEPVAGVVVSDGVNVTRTDSNGTYYLPTDISLADHIRITIPSGYEMVGKRNISPAFFSPVDSSAVGLQAHDFQLKRVDQSNYTLMVVADSHVIGAGAQNGPYGSTTDRSTYCNVVMPKWNEYAASCPGPVYGVHLGDMTQVGQWRYYSLAKYRTDTSVSTVPIFNALGNHDHDKPTSGKVFSEQEQHLARKTFSATIGPAYYSFDIGTEHYIVLDNVVILDSDSTTNGVDDTLTNGYKIKVDPIQLQWLELDVAHIDKSKIKGIVICAHCPLLRSTGSNYMINAAEVIEIVKEFPVTALIGHNHNDRFVAKNLPTYGKTMREYLHPSLAGTAWLTSSCTEGTPASIVAYTFNAGKTASRTYVPYGDNENLRYRVYDKAIPAPSFLSVPAPETALPKAKFSAVSVSVVVSERIAFSSTEILPEEPSACAFFRTREPPVTDAVPSKEALVPAKICVPAPLLTRFKLFRNCPWNVYSLLSAVSISSVRRMLSLLIESAPYTTPEKTFEMAVSSLFNPAIFVLVAFTPNPKVILSLSVCFKLTTDLEATTSSERTSDTFRSPPCPGLAVLERFISPSKSEF